MSDTTAGGDDLSRNTTVMAAGTTLSRLTGFGRVFALAYALGLTRVTDSYNLANTTPNIVYELVVGGVLSATLLPVFVRLHATSDEDDAWKGISAIVTVVAVIVVALSVVLAVAAPLIIRLYTLANHGSTAEDQRAVATSLLRLFAPQVAFYGLVTVSTALLHAHRRFALPMFTPVLNNIVVIAVLLAFPHVAGSLSLHALVDDQAALLWLGLGTTIGVAAMAVPQWVAARRRGGGRLRWHWQPRHPAVRTVLRLSVWTFAFTAANQVAYWVVLLLANRNSGDLSAYQAAYQYFFLLPHGIVAVSVMSALQPDLAEHWSLARVGEFRARLTLGLRTLLAVLVPAAVGYVTLGQSIVRLLLGHGAMTANDADVVADVLALMALGLPAFSAYLLLMRAYQAMQDTRQVFLLYLVENAINIALAFALYPSMGVRGLALAFSLAYTVGTLGALITMRARTGGVDGRALLSTALRVSLASALMGVVTLLGARFVGSGSGLGLVLRVAVSVIAGVTVYVAAARRLAIDEFFALLPLRRSGIRKGKGRAE